MLEGGTIRYCAEQVSVSIPTSFFMRHRILDVINLSLKNETLSGIVEADVCYINESFKGAHIKKDDALEEKFFQNNLIDKERNKKYSSEKYFSNFEKAALGCGDFFFNTTPNTAKNHIKNIKQNQICISTAIDRNGHIITRVVDSNLGGTNNKIKPKNMVSFFNGNLGEDVILCAYRTFLYRETVMKYGVKLRQSPRPYRPIYTVNHVYKYHWELKRWLKNFNGVATKYLNNYLAWFKFLFLSKVYKKIVRIKDLFMSVATKYLYITKNMIKNRCIELL